MVVWYSMLEMNVSADIVKLLSDENTPVSSIVSVISELEKSGGADKILSPNSALSFGLSANITIDGFDLEVKRQGFLHGYRPFVQIGNYRDHVGNAEKFAASRVRFAVFLWFFDALLPGLSVRVSSLSRDDIGILVETFTRELHLVLRYADRFDRLFIPRMHKIRFGSSMRSETTESRLIDTFNSVMDEEIGDRGNVVLLDAPSIVSRLGVRNCIDERMNFLYKRPYTEKFYYHLASDIFREIRGGDRYFRKILVLDCDNTLWRGIIGEDGLSGIQLCPEDFPGNVFWQAQHAFLSLQKRGVLLALCSKNDPQSVDEVLERYEFCPIRNEHIVIKKVNWRSKVENMQEIASELDLGLDSFVFLDDSDFECEAVRSALPQVTVFQVPEKISEYPKVWKAISDLFPMERGASQEKTREYRLRAVTRQEAAKWENKDDYLRSLETKVVVRRNEKERIPRIAELTRKTNQFNLTTRRYSDIDIANFMDSDESDVYSVHVSDKFGSSGLVGVCIVRRKGTFSIIDTFLLSCRVIGRGIESSIWGRVLKDAAETGTCALRAEYIATEKNGLVRNFYETLGFEKTLEDSRRKEYVGSLADLENLGNMSGKYFLEVTYDV